MLAIQSVWAWAVPVTVSKAPVAGFVNENGFSHVASDIGCFTVAFDANHPAGCELIIAADLTAAENSAGISGNGREGNARQLRHSRCHTEIGNRDSLAPEAPPDVASDVAPRPRENWYWHVCGLRCPGKPAPNRQRCRAQWP